MEETVAKTKNERRFDALICELAKAYDETQSPECFVKLLNRQPNSADPEQFRSINDSEVVTVKEQSLSNYRQVDISVPVTNLEKFFSDINVMSKKYSEYIVIDDDEQVNIMESYNLEKPDLVMEVTLFLSNDFPNFVQRWNRLKIADLDRLDLFLDVYDLLIEIKEALDQSLTSNKLYVESKTSTCFDETRQEQEYDKQKARKKALDFLKEKGIFCRYEISELGDTVILDLDKDDLESALMQASSNKLCTYFAISNPCGDQDVVAFLKYSEGAIVVNNQYTIKRLQKGSFTRQFFEYIYEYYNNDQNTGKPLTVGQIKKDLKECKSRINNLVSDCGFKGKVQNAFWGCVSNKDHESVELKLVLRTNNFNNNQEVQEFLQELAS